jgi:SAM-dependent methyltransferase
MDPNTAALPPIEEVTMRAMLNTDERHWWFRGRRRILRAEIDCLALPGGIEILDAGCGSGRNMQELAGYGTVSGIELSEQAAEVARARKIGEVKVGRVENLPWVLESFDLVICLDVIEHTPDDRVTFTELLRICRPGGHLLVTVPAYEALWSRHDEISRHYRRYSRRTLARAATAAGWELERMTSFNSLLLAPAAAMRLLQRVSPGAAGDPQDGGAGDLDVGPAWLNPVLEWPMRMEARWLARGRTLPVGLSLLAVLRRPAAG